MMGTMGRYCWKYDGFYSLRCIVQRQFFYSTTTSTGGAISSSKEPNSLSSLPNFLVGSLGFSEKQAVSTSTKLTKFRRGAAGIPLGSIRNRMLQQSAPFMRNPQDFKDIMARAEAKWGVSPCSPMFLYAVHLLCSLNEKNIESKRQLFESFGWDRSHVVDLFRRNPLCFGLSKGNIEAKLRFFMNELGYDPGYIATHPTFLIYSLEKRVLPRHRVFQLLKEKDLLRRNSTFSGVLRLPEERFLRKFVLCLLHIVPNLDEIYANSMRSSSLQQMKRAKNTPFSTVRLKPGSACVQGLAQPEA